MKHQLIIIDGQSTVGKSTISKSVYNQIAKYEESFWLHEECEKHPIRFEEFEAGDIHTLEGMELNRHTMLSKWKEFMEDIMQSQKNCITEGCFFHSMDRYLLESAWNDDQISEYFKQILEIMKPLNPLIVFLHRPDLKQSYEKAFKSRGDWWRKLILGVPEPYGYFEHHEYTGEDSIFAGLTYEQDQMRKIYDLIDCEKLKIDTSNENWNTYVRQITETTGFQYLDENNELPDVEKYCGTYKLVDGEDKWYIHFDKEKNELYTSLFWPYMPMRYVGNNEFELISFPVTLRFAINIDSVNFIVQGNYDWNYNEKKFIKV